jgi:hypothetical protein
MRGTWHARPARVFDRVGVLAHYFIGNGLISQYAGSEVLRRAGFSRAIDPALRSTSEPAFPRKSAATTECSAKFCRVGVLAHHFPARDEYVVREFAQPTKSPKSHQTHCSWARRARRS